MEDQGARKAAAAPWDIIEKLMERTAAYVYCIVHAAEAPRVARAPRGLAGSTAVATVKVARNLWLALAAVPLSTYGPDVLEQSLRDMNWVGDVALAHEAVVEYFARLAKVTVIPMTLFTMFSSERRAIDETAGRRREIGALVKRLAGCEEWGVRMTRTPTAAPARRAAGARPTSGAAFLAAKKEARDLARESLVALAASADHAFRLLAVIARDAHRRDDVPEGATSPPLLDAAFLVPVARRTRFKAAAKRLAAGSARQGASLALTGPWPPYNFVHSDARHE